VEQTIYGTITKVDTLDRIFHMHYKDKIIKVYMQRGMFTKLGKYIQPNNKIVLKIEGIKRNKYGKQFITKHVLKIINPRLRNKQVLYSQELIEHETRTFINQLDKKMFLDLEMSMHPYKVDKHFVQEIIQVGYIIVDEHDQVIERYQAYIKPTKHKTLTKRTLKFLDLTQEQVDQGVPFKQFYAQFKDTINRYKPAIIVWGKNDHLALRDAYKVNKLKTLARRTRFVNLLQIHKNVFMFKNDLGLLNAYKMYGYNPDKEQRHDAYEDALMTRRIFSGFKAYLNHQKVVDLKAFPNLK